MDVGIIVSGRLDDAVTVMLVSSAPVVQSESDVDESPGVEGPSVTVVTILSGVTDSVGIVGPDCEVLSVGKDVKVVLEVVGSGSVVVSESSEVIVPAGLVGPRAEVGLTEAEVDESPGLVIDVVVVPGRLDVAVVVTLVGSAPVVQRESDVDKSPGVEGCSVIVIPVLSGVAASVGIVGPDCEVLSVGKDIMVVVEVIDSGAVVVPAG